MTDEKEKEPYAKQISELISLGKIAIFVLALIGGVGINELLSL